MHEQWESRFLLPGHHVSPADDERGCTACVACFPDHHLSNSDRRSRRLSCIALLTAIGGQQNAPPGVQRRWGVSYRSRIRR
jgi:hypothetical protein